MNSLWKDSSSYTGHHWTIKNYTYSSYGEYLEIPPKWQETNLGDIAFSNIFPLPWLWKGKLVLGKKRLNAASKSHQSLPMKSSKTIAQPHNMHSMTDKKHRGDFNHPKWEVETCLRRRKEWLKHRWNWLINMVGQETRWINWSYKWWWNVVIWFVPYGRFQPRTKPSKWWFWTSLKFEPYSSKSFPLCFHTFEFSWIFWKQKSKMKSVWNIVILWDKKG